MGIEPPQFRLQLPCNTLAQGRMGRPNEFTT